MGKKQKVQVLTTVVLVLALVFLGLVYSGYGSNLIGSMMGSGAKHIGTPAITLDVPTPGAVVPVTAATRFNWEVDDGGHNMTGYSLCIWDANMGKGAPRYCTQVSTASEATISGVSQWTVVLRTLYGAAITPTAPTSAPRFPTNPLSWYAKGTYLNSYGDPVTVTSVSREFTLKK